MITLKVIATLAIMIIGVIIGVPLLTYIIGKPMWWIFDKLCGPFV